AVADTRAPRCRDAVPAGAFRVSRPCRTHYCASHTIVNHPLLAAERGYRCRMLQLTQIDPFDDAAVDLWWDIYAAAERADRGTDTAVWTRNESRHELRQRSDTIERRAYLARRSGEIIAGGKLALPLRDNVSTASLGVHVAP